MQKQIWKEVDGWNKYYHINTNGELKALEQKGISKDGRKLLRKEIILKPFRNKKNKNSYFSYKLRAINGNKEKTVMAHRLVAMAFIPNPENKPEVNHKDGNKLNNHVDNLEWVTKKENARHSIDNKLQIPFKGEEVGNSKLKEKQVLEIRSIGKSMTLKEIAKIYNVRVTTIWQILHYKTWKHI